MTMTVGYARETKFTASKKEQKTARNSETR